MNAGILKLSQVLEIATAHLSYRHIEMERFSEKKKLETGENTFFDHDDLSKYKRSASSLTPTRHSIFADVLVDYLKTKNLLNNSTFPA